MLTNYERGVATILVEALCEYGLTENLAQFGKHDTENWFRNNNLCDADFWISSGATKVCIGHNDLRGWVIKVGYTENVKKDYATYEYNVYCMAEEVGLARYFPETIYLGEFYGRPFYVQQEADCDEGQVTSDWYERLCNLYKEVGEEYDPNYLWDELDCMGAEDKARLCFGDEALCNFLWEHKVGDLHEGNFGYIRGCLVIVDFAGFAD